ncbi:cytochrome bd-I oxidase subunit CydX [Burkholderia sp. WSM2230]|uniref:cytochrome bd-I oxidase subunit CydX n=1 Tax=Burkholderia sp. WSM2230 TaxID=944435 RepID=UPI0012EC23DA|nr:cytochrome bd-I oxidase subunit CydX [Burkholderia sp. WSM2230]
MIVAKDNSKETAMWCFTWMPAIAAALCFGMVRTMRLAVDGNLARDRHRAALLAKDWSS